jgi:hypothetical protein
MEICREGPDRVGLWRPEPVDNNTAELRERANFFDSFLGVILSTQILHDVFTENPCAGDPESFMVDKTPDVTRFLKRDISW